MDITAVVSIGGKGTRISSISGGLPKALIKINGKTVLYRIAEQISSCGIKNLFLLRGHKSNFFEDEVSKIKNKLDLRISNYIEDLPLGECGALWKIRNKILTKDILFILGDIVFDLELKKFISFHKRLDSKFTLISHIATHPEDSDIIRTPNGVQITDFKFKKQSDRKGFKGFLGNAGIMLFNKEVIDLLTPYERKEDVTAFKNLAFQYFKKSGKIFSYNTSEYIKDMGTEDRFIEVVKDDKQKIIERKNYKYKQKCLFLDRDNTLISCPIGNYICKEEEVNIRQDKIAKLVKIRTNFDLCLIITNQPQIAMGKITLENLYDINSFLIVELLKLGLKVDDISFCPHHPHKGFKGEIADLKIDCFCRKPNPGMIIQQAFLKNIDLENSLFIGDSDHDKLAAEYAGLKFINIKDI